MATTRITLITMTIVTTIGGMGWVITGQKTPRTDVDGNQKRAVRVILAVCYTRVPSFVKWDY